MTSGLFASFFYWGQVQREETAFTLEAESIIEFLELEDIRHARVAELPYGVRKRVDLGRALAMRPKVLILDEPTDGLDPNQKHDMRDLIREMGRTKSIIISTHVLEEVEAVCSRAVIISQGRIVAQGTPNEFKSRSNTGRIDDYFREVTGAGRQAASHSGA